MTANPRQNRPATGIAAIGKPRLDELALRLERAVDNVQNLGRRDRAGEAAKRLARDDPQEPLHNRGNAPRKPVIAFPRGDRRSGHAGHADVGRDPATAPASVGAGLPYTLGRAVPAPAAKPHSRCPRPPSGACSIRARFFGCRFIETSGT